MPRTDNDTWDLAHSVGANSKLATPKPNTSPRGVGRIRFRPSSSAGPAARNASPPIKSSARGTFHHSPSRPLKAATARKGRALFHPLRLALTGEERGPELRDLLPLIGRERARQRLLVAAS